MSSKSDTKLDFYAAAGFLAGIWLFYEGFRKLRLKKFIQALPTSKARSMAMGTVEVFGTAHPHEPLEDPIYKRPCVFYHVKVQEQRGSGKRSKWVTVYDEGSFDKPFWVQDETGRVPIFPQGAESHFKSDVDVNAIPVPFVGGFLRLGDTDVGKFLTSLPGLVGNSVHIVAQIIREGDPMYALGFAVPLDKPLTLGEKLRGRVKLTFAEMVRRLRSNPERMREIDLNKDKAVDFLEWEAGVRRFREDLEREAAQAQGEAAGPPAAPVASACIRKHPDGPFFILSDQQERDLVEELSSSAQLMIVGGPILTITCGIWLFNRFTGVWRP